MNNLLFSFNIDIAFIATFLSETLGFWYFILVNVCGVLAIGFKIWESQCRKRKVIITLACLSSASWVTYYVLNGNLTTALVGTMGIVAYLIFAQREKHKWANSKFWLYAFLALQIAVCVFTYSNWTSLSACSAGIFSAFAYFTTSEKSYRWTLLGCQTSWLINSISNLYLVASIADTIITTSIVIALVRFSIAEKKSKKEQNEIKADENSDTTI